MSKGVALLVLAAFAAGALALAAWGLADILRTRTALRACLPEIPFDTSAHWFLGASVIAMLPFLAVLKSERSHAWIFRILLVGFFLLPALSHALLRWTAASQSYDQTVLIFVPPQSILLSHDGLEPCIPIG
ncbi:MAG: hypothetical protein AAFQ66_15240 [Pseudomonadota bacterium]